MTHITIKNGYDSLNDYQRETKKLEIEALLISERFNEYKKGNVEAGRVYIF